MYIDTLRANGYYALAQYCKMREKFNSVPLFEAKLTPVEHRWLVLSGLPDVDMIKTLVDEHAPETDNMFVWVSSVEHYILNTLECLNNIAKREIIRSQAAHFSNEFHYKKSLLSGTSDHYPELRAWFDNIAQKNQGKYWGIAAENVVKLIDKRMQRLGEK